MDKVYACFIIKKGEWKRVVITEETAEKAESKIRNVLSWAKVNFTIIGIELVTIANGRAKRPLWESRQ